MWFSERKPFVTFSLYFIKILVSLKKKHLELRGFEKTPFIGCMLGKNSCLKIYFVSSRKQNKNKKQSFTTRQRFITLYPLSNVFKSSLSKDCFWLLTLWLLVGAAF